MAGILYIYDKPGHGGRDAQITHDEPDLRNVSHGAGNWNDEMQSLNIVEGSWEFYEHINFGGTKVGPLGRGTNGNCEQFGIPNNWVSSIKKVSD